MPSVEAPKRPITRTERLQQTIDGFSKLLDPRAGVLSSEASARISRRLELRRAKGLPDSFYPVDLRSPNVGVLSIEQAIDRKTFGLVTIAKSTAEIHLNLYNESLKRTREEAVRLGLSEEAVEAAVLAANTPDWKKAPLSVKKLNTSSKFPR